VSELSVRGLRVEFGGLVAVDDLDLTVRAHEIHGVIGPNGAGKTTVLNVITRLQAPDAGAMTLDGENLLAARPHELARLGMARTFQHVELFTGLSVLENVMLGHLTRGRSGFTGALLRSPGARRDLAHARARARELLALVGLGDAGHRAAAALPFAQQQLVGLARALACDPRLLLLDEPAASMTGAEVAVLRQLLRHLRAESHLTIVLVEHVMELVMGVCDRLTVLNHGRKIAEGAPDTIRADPGVIAAYLGARAQHA
jgi:branched-chain amino acid transport system ATP-binding protein